MILKVMKDKDIYELFSRVAEQPDQNNESARKVFSALVKSTLKYRDHIKEATGIIVTVEDVKTALNWLIPSLKTGRLPETDNKIQLDLLKLWLDEFRVF